MAEWILLIPPSETKATPPVDGPSYDTVKGKAKYDSFRELENFRRLVMENLSGLIDKGMGLERVLEVSGTALAEAVEANRTILASPTMPARELYAGVMYEAIDYGSLKAAQKKLFNKNALIFSGLFGLLRPSDYIPPYKLKIGSNLGGTVGKLTQFWRRPVSEVLRHEVRGKVVWDFLPDQHRRVWDNTGEVRARHQVKFVKRIVRSGVAEYKTISHHSKALKGALIRHLLANDASKPTDLKDFTHPDGYRYMRELSVEKKEGSLIVFAAD